MEFSKKELVDIITKNKDEHRMIFEEAIEGYRKKAIEELEAYVERVKRGDVIRVYVSLPQPDDHTRDYDRILKMLSMTTEDTVELGETQFSQYVLDDWQWKMAFLGTNSSYSVTAANQLAQSSGDIY